MPYPPEYSEQTDFALEDQQGTAVSGVKLATELANLGMSLNQCIDFIRALAAADKSWKPATQITMTLNQTQTFTATAGQTQFSFTGGVTADVSTDKVLVFSDGSLIRPSLVTLAADKVTIPAQTVGAIVVVALYNDAASLATNLAATTASKGASLVGVEDAGGLLTATTVEGALAEIATDLASLTTSVGNITGYVKADGTVAFTADQSMGGFKLTNLAAPTSANDAARKADVDALDAIYGDLAIIYLALAGGTMSGPIAMGSNKITGLANGTNAQDAVTKSQLDAQATTNASTYLPLDGSVAMDGILNMAGNVLEGLPAPTGPTEPVRNGDLASSISSALSTTLFGTIGGTRVLTWPTAGSIPDFTNPDVYDLDAGASFTTNPTIDSCVTIRSPGNMVAQSRTWSIGSARAATTALTPDTSYSIAKGPLPIHQAGEGKLEGAFSSGGGGGVGGNGGTGAAGTPANQLGQGIVSTLNLRSLWRHNAHFEGNNGGGSGGGTGGGSIRLLVNGDLDLTGTTITADGGDHVGSDGGGGGGGSIVIVCTGTITCGAGATLRARGGAGGNDSDAAVANEAGGGGGGYVAVVAKQIMGTLNIDVSGGDCNAAPGYTGGDGGLIEVSTSDALTGTVSTDVTGGLAGNGSAGSAGAYEQSSHDREDLVYGMI